MARKPRLKPPEDGPPEKVVAPVSSIIKSLKGRRQVAQVERDQFQPLLDEAYDYAIPYRKGAGAKTAGRGEKRVDRAFDQTAIVSAFRFAGKVQQDLWPAGQANFTLEPGPVAKATGNTDDLAAELQKIATVVGSFFLDGSWDLAFHEMALDLSAGTGAMLMLDGDEEQLARFESVPINELLLEGGRKPGIFWSRCYPLREVDEMWPKGNLGEMAKYLADKPEEEIEVHQDTVWDPKTRRWKFVAWSDKCGDQPIWESEYVACPWLTPRYFRVPGETYGRGPVMLAMPTIKTLNTAAKLQLQAAAIAMLGIYTAIDDGVFNPAASPLEPGVFWKVGRNGGALGPTVSRFPDPRLDLSNLVLSELRMGVQSTMMDQSLPADGAAVRSATEILERVKRLASDHLGAFGRLVQEIVIPAVKRAIEIAWRRNLIAQNIPIDQLLIKVKVNSPMAIAREAERVQKIIQWLTIVLQFMGPQAGRVANIEAILAEAGRALGVPEELIANEEQREEFDKRQAAMAAAALAAKMGHNGGPALEEEPAAAVPPETVA